MSEVRPLRVLMLSRDRLGLDAVSLPAERWMRLVEQGIALEVWILAPETTHWERPGIRVTGTGGASFLARAWNVLKRVPVEKPDLITAQNPAEVGWLAARLARRLHAKLELQDHSGGFDGSGKIDESWNGVRFLLARFLVQRSDAVRTVNPQSATWLAEHTKAYVYWLPIVPRQAFLAVKRRTIPGRYVCVARLVPVKRHRLLLEVFAQLRRLQPDATLALVGDGPERASLEACASELGIAPSVLFVGRADPLSYLAEADVCVSLSRHEGWGVAAIEAAMAGVPVVMTDTGCARFLEERGQAYVLRKLTIPSMVEALHTQRGKRVNGLKEVWTPAQAAIEQVRHWTAICR